MIFTASEVSSLAISLEHWEWAEYASCALVALGCTGEYIAEFTDCWTGGLKERKDRLAKRSTLLLISALALELMCLVKTNSISGMLIGSLSEKASAAETKAQSAFDKSVLAESNAGNASVIAGDALTDSKTAKDTAGKAQEKADGAAEQADDLLKKYVDAENKLLKLQFLVVPREHLLMGAGRGCAFVKAVQPFAGQKIEIRTDPSRIPDPRDVEEMRLFVITIEFLLGQVSEWSISEAKGYNGWGVTLGVRRNSSPETRRAADTLASAFADCGVTDMQGNRPAARVVSAGSNVDRENGSPDTIVLFVGEHPH